MKRYFLKLAVAAMFSVGLGIAAEAQTIYPTPFFTSFADTMIASTYNGQPLVVGSIIQAYDQAGTYCGVDTVRWNVDSTQAIFGYFSVYGDDPNTPVLDEGATSGETISFRINGRAATVTAGDPTWSDQTLKSVTLSASATIAMTGLTLPGDTLVVPGDTAVFRVQVRNDGDGTDFYGVRMSMSMPGGPGPFDWEAFPPDTVVYADAGQTVWVYFSARAPVFSADTTNTITYKVFSHLDTTVNVTGSFNLIMTLTDVDEYDPNLPGSFALFQNYPNPFNPTTTIAYRLNSATYVRLDVYDVLGRVVERVDLGWLSPGDGEIVYDGSELASGVYFYRLTTEASSRTRKMILLK
ncbi:MAG: T9SS type A sorting domain-containing protein [Candidatus Zixiibacteriota bacterium]